MISGHVNRTNRPNTWLHRPSLRREDSPCQPGAVHTWHIADMAAAPTNVRCWVKSGQSRDKRQRTVPGLGLMQVESPDQSEYPWDYDKHVATAPGDQAFSPVVDGACPGVP